MHDLLEGTEPLSQPCSLDAIQEIEESLIPMTMQALRNHRPFEYIEGGAQNCDVVARKVGSSAGSKEFTSGSGLGRFTAVSRFGFFQFVPQKRPTLRRSTSFLLVLNLVLITTLTVALRREDLPDVSVSAAISENVENWLELGLTNSGLSRGTFDIISNRPLLDPSRRPLILESLPELEPEPLAIELIGTYLSDTERTALVRLGTQKHAVWVREREYISSWQVEKIHADRLHLRRIDEARFVHLWPES
jgi:hypothetical protein